MEIDQGGSKMSNENQYDAAAKNFLASKMLLAHILKGCVPEFRDFDIETIITEGLEKEAEVSKVVVHRPVMLQGMSTEDATPDEGTVFYDIRADVTVPGTDRERELIINVEAQKGKPSEYPLTKRGLYYCSRMISAQKETRFTKQDYGRITKVYSIWILMNVGKEESNSIVEYSMEEKPFIGGYHTEKKDYDLISMIVVALGEESETSNGFLRLLDTVFKSGLSSDAMREKLKNEFDVVLTPEMEKEVTEMCNLSVGIEERGIAKGIERGIAKGARETNRRLREDGISQEKRALYVGVPVEMVKTWDEEEMPVPV